MITGFLFFSKVIESKNKPIKWGRLFIGRIMRLVPMYIFSILLLFLIVAVLSDGSINDSANNLFHGLLQWLTFTLKSAPNLNGVNNTFIINAGVSWSLVYEWYFYLSLPTLMFIVKGKPPIGYAIIGSIGLTLLINLPHRTLLLAFVGGMVAAVSVRFEGLRKFCEKPLCSFMVMVLISVAITRFYYVYKVVPIILLALSFIIIVNGNTLFGILIHPVSRVLGEISYSIYLLHGIVLFVTFNFIIGLDTARSLTPIIHWVVVVGVVPILILISFMTFRYIETPFMQRSLKIT
jgi:peptidoglycan/LPS O-acetylase OafA/YrhL